MVGVGSAQWSSKLCGAGGAKRGSLCPCSRDALTEFAMTIVSG